MQQQLCKSCSCSCRTCFMFYCMFYFTCDRSLSVSFTVGDGGRGSASGSRGLSGTMRRCDAVRPVAELFAAAASCCHAIYHPYMICDFVERGIICQRELLTGGAGGAPYGAAGCRMLRRRHPVGRSRAVPLRPPWGRTAKKG